MSQLAARLPGSSASTGAPGSVAALREPATPAEQIAAFVATVSAALADDDIAERLGQAGVLVRLDCTDRPVQPIFIALDAARPHITLDPPTRRPDVVLTLTTPDLDGCLRQGVELPLRILSGEIAFEGCVRKFLRVLPVLRAEVQRLDGAAG